MNVFFIITCYIDNGRGLEEIENAIKQLGYTIKTSVKDKENSLSKRRV